MITFNEWFEKLDNSQPLNEDIGPLRKKLEDFAQGLQNSEYIDIDTKLKSMRLIKQLDNKLIKNRSQFLPVKAPIVPPTPKPEYLPVKDDSDEFHLPDKRYDPSELRPGLSQRTGFGYTANGGRRVIKSPRALN